MLSIVFLRLIDFFIKFWLLESLITSIFFSYLPKLILFSKQIIINFIFFFFKNFANWTNKYFILPNN